MFNNYRRHCGLWLHQFGSTGGHDIGGYVARRAQEVANLGPFRISAPKQKGRIPKVASRAESQAAPKMGVFSSFWQTRPGIFLV